ncbi:calcium activated cation channel [Rhodocollybia butyracea]|uniref:Calcium activated cation channel n=1 Tax=Rhodocollybia butyracea TaxID=206335 RepID=A0A9P5Q980_9AGAR|nr:calcium activated cation channel [Rhodocollybia butyracea]
MFDDPSAESGRSGALLPVKTVKPSPDTLTKLIKRLRALTLKLLPGQVDSQEINGATSRIITQQVISAYRAAAGDFEEALPYCLLRARAEFKWDADHNPADYDENHGRAIACEVLARRIIHLMPPDRLAAVMATRYTHMNMDDDESDPASALEMAIDSHCTIFLSSSESQDVVNSLWMGDLIQKMNEKFDVDYVSYSESHDGSFWSHLDPARLCVPRYQNFFRITLWFFLLFVYSQAVREPLERLADPYSNTMDIWEILLYVLGLATLIEDINRFFKLVRFVTWRVVSFWSVVALVTNSLLLAAFILRVIGLYDNTDNSSKLRLNSFQVLSFVAPFICLVAFSLALILSSELITVFDGYKYVGMMQICVARMLQESGIFFALLSILALGFAQAMYALDAADGSTEAASGVVNALVQALLASPDFSRYSGSSSGLTMYYLWNVVTVVILLNVLISLFSSAYQDVVDDAEAQYLAFFASKTIGMIRAPDSYVYPAPFNLIETLFISPFEYCLSEKAYAKMNRITMSVLFFIPLTLIALYEALVKHHHGHGWMTNWLRGENEGDDSYPETTDPEVDGADATAGRSISKVPFNELIKAFPNTAQSSEALMLAEIRDLRNQLNLVLQKLSENESGRGVGGLED